MKIMIGIFLFSLVWYYILYLQSKYFPETLPSRKGGKDNYDIEPF